MAKHLCVPVKRRLLRRWLCIHCGDVFRYNADAEGCTYHLSDVPNDGNRCHPDYGPVAAVAPCTCPCVFCQTFTGVKS